MFFYWRKDRMYAYIRWIECNCLHFNQDIIVSKSWYGAASRCSLSRLLNNNCSVLRHDVRSTRVKFWLVRRCRNREWPNTLIWELIKLMNTMNNRGTLPHYKADISKTEYRKYKYQGTAPNFALNLHRQSTRETACRQSEGHDHVQ